MKVLPLTLILASLSSFAQTNKRIIDKDSRVQITASRFRSQHASIGLLFVISETNMQMCTATVIGPRHAVTAAHCFMSEGGFFNAAVSFYPGIHEAPSISKPPHGVFNSSKIRILDAYFESPGPKNDLALITFSRDLPVPALPLGVITKDISRITIAGYPADKVEGTLWEASGRRHVGFLGGTTLGHEVDTMPGESGSAVRVEMKGRQTVVGVHSGGVNGLIWDYNQALFFNAGHVRLLKTWMAKD